MPPSTAQQLHVKETKRSIYLFTELHRNKILFVFYSDEIASPIFSG
jgi:hypothetical protein